MYSSSDLVSYQPLEGMLEILVPHLATLEVEQNFLNNLNAIEIITPSTESITFIKLVTPNPVFTFNTNLSSNGNIALLCNASMHVLKNVTIKAEQLFLTTYFTEQISHTAGLNISLNPAYAYHTILNYGHIVVDQSNSAVATHRFLNKGTVSAKIDSKTFVGLNKPLVKTRFSKRNWCTHLHDACQCSFQTIQT